METSFSGGVIDTFVDPPMKKFRMWDKTLKNCFDKLTRKLGLSGGRGIKTGL